MHFLCKSQADFFSVRIVVFTQGSVCSDLQKRPIDRILEKSFEQKEVGFQNKLISSRRHSNHVAAGRDDAVKSCSGMKILSFQLLIYENCFQPT